MPALSQRRQNRSLAGDAVLANPDGKLVENTCTTLRNCVANTNDAIFRHADELHAMRAMVDVKLMYTKTFVLAERACGIK